MVQWLELCLPTQRVQIQSLVRELKSHMPHGQKTPNIKQKQYCNKFNEDFLKKENETHYLLNQHLAMVFPLFQFGEIFQFSVGE